MNTPLQSKQSGFLRLDLDTKASDGTFEGYGSVFGVVDHGGDMVLPGAFALSLADHRKNGTFPLMLWQHKQDTPIGRWVAMEEDRIGLRVKGKLNLNTTAGADAFAHIKEGDVSGLSIGYRLPPNGVEILPSGIQQIKTASLFEVSVVSLPMNDAARIQLGSKADLERLLAKSGLAREAARRVAFGGWPALTQTPSSDLSPLLQALRASADRF